MKFDSQKSQSSIKTDKASFEASGSELPAKKKKIEGPHTTVFFFEDRLQKRLDDDSINNCLILEILGGTCVMIKAA